ncbi:hypothetical protein [Sorangium sp. So ce1024]|uniref:hypothetical protein n=1 Tax=Sorangium sp. So ce1024 TaxID=3133327 RepID=UPI003F073872
MQLAAHRTSRLPRARGVLVGALLAALLAAAGWTGLDSIARSRTHAEHGSAGLASPGSPLGELSRTVADVAPVIGVVEERLPAGSYTYLAVRPDGGSPVWVVTLGGGQPVGARVSIRSYGRRTDFASRRLKRTFPVLVFGVVSRADER